MKVSLNWLGDHLDLAGYSTRELDDLLTFSGIEVEGIESRGVDIDRLVVAEVLSFEKHPNADKLSVCQVDDGHGPDRPRQIVCGAKNYKPGDKAPLALPGCVLGEEKFEIEEGDLRGVKSLGMLCSAFDLGLEAESDGLLILDPAARPGTPLRDLWESDTVFELEITPNRPDCLCHLGVARELAALTKTNLQGPAHHGGFSTPSRPAEPGEIRIRSKKACPLYTGRWIRGVQVTESPVWLKRKLESIGLRPINNIVDITNYVLMEMGQPLHAFDLGKLRGGIQVRPARNAEKFLALDGETYTLTKDDLVIADQDRAVAIGGVMGGEQTGVTESTVDILLESAYFAPAGIRRTARRLNLHSDSSYRFERGVDPAQVAGASDLATRLIAEIAGGSADEEILICGNPPRPPKPVRLVNRHCRELIGCDIPDGTIDEILASLGLEKSRTSWRIPTYRADLGRPVDLIEEVARVYGLDQVPSSTLARFAPASKPDLAYDFARAIQTRLAGLGFFETRNLKLVSGAQLDDDRATSHRGLSPIRLKNPLNDEQDRLRPALLPGMLATARRNARQGNSDLRLFEIGRVFLASPKGDEIEREHLALLMTGLRHARSWHQGKPGSLDLFDLRNVLENLCPGVALRFAAVEDPRLLCAASVEIGAGKNSAKLGLAGILPPARTRELDLATPIAVAELDLKKLAAALGAPIRFDELPRYPSVTRDIAIEAPASLQNAAIESFFAKRNQPLLESFEMIDLFRDPTGEKLPADKNSITWSLTYRSKDRTLESAEVDRAHSEILDSLRSEFPVEFR